MKDRTEEYSIEHNGKEYHVRISPLDHDHISIEIEGISYKVRIIPDESGSAASSDGLGLTKVGGAEQGDLAIYPPMPGRIVSISKVEGDTIRAGECLIVLEAMKMENEINSPRDGILRSIKVNVGETVQSSDVLLIIGSKDR